MKDRLWSAYYHGISIDDNPQHEKCSDKWCFFKIAERDNKELKGHEEEVHTKISPAIQEKVHNLYIRLTKDELLNGCVNG